MKRSITIILMLIVTSLAFAQSNERDCIRLGNKFYREGQYSQAETFYRKSIDKKPTIEAYYNLANSLVMQGKDSTAYETYRKALDIGTANKGKLAQIYHNMGNITYANGCAMLKANSPEAVKSFEQAVELFKSSLRCNPADNETRYNLAMAQYQLKKSKQNQNNNQQNQDNKDQNKDQNKQDQDQNKQDQNKDDKQDNKDQQQDPPKQNKNDMDDNTAEQLLNSAQQDEKNVQNKVKQGKSTRRRSLEKDW